MPKKIDMTNADDIKVTDRISSGDHKFTKILYIFFYHYHYRLTLCKIIVKTYNYYCPHSYY